MYKRQVYNYKTNNNGKDLSNEQTILTGSGWQEVPLSGFLAQPGISAPLDKKRLLFNETHTLNGNRMYKWNEDRSLRMQAGYTHDVIRQQRGNTQIYYQPTDTIQIDETYHYRLRSDAANLELRYEDNSNRNYISNRFTMDGEINHGRSEEHRQTLRTSRLSAGKMCIRDSPHTMCILFCRCHFQYIGILYSSYQFMDKPPIFQQIAL